MLQSKTHFQQIRVDDALSSAWRELREQAAREKDPETLRELVVQVNLLLDVIEARVAKLVGGARPR